MSFQRVLGTLNFKALRHCFKCHFASFFVDFLLQSNRLGGKLQGFGNMYHNYLTFVLVFLNMTI